MSLFSDQNASGPLRVTIVAETEPTDPDYDPRRVVRAPGLRLVLR
jgi:hypothetical protein